MDLEWIRGKIKDLETYKNYKFTEDDIIQINNKRLESQVAPKNTDQMIARKHLLDNKLNYLESKFFMEETKELKD